MNKENDFRIYRGKGEQSSLPSFEKFSLFDDPKSYIAKESLSDAVSVALYLGQPLLITGEPGTGKTQLAYSIAYEFGERPVLRFNTKSTSTAKDLFYRYDALRHFHDAQLNSKESRGKKLSAEPYITYEALG
ncbi:MAG: AAA family ATPase, partial [Pyrinomonadaceae bacterium]